MQLNQHRAPYAFRSSQAGALEGGEPHYTADGIFTEPMGLDQELSVVRYTQGPKSDRLKIIERKPRQPLHIAPIDDLQGICNVWEAPRRTSREQQPKEDSRFVTCLYAAGSLVAMAAVGVILAYRG